MPLWLLLLCGGPLLRVLGYQLELQESVTVQEGLCVHVRCKFFLPWFSFGFIPISWFQKGANVYYDPPVATNKQDRKLHERTQGRFFLLGDPQTKDCSLYITDVNMGDSGTYFLRVETHSYLYNMLSLNVTALTHTPHILTPGTLESGRPGNLNCSVPWACERGMPPIFSWTSAAFTSLGPRTRLSSVLTLTPRPQDHGTNLTCQVQFPAIGVMVERTIQLNVTYAPQNTAIRIFQGNRIGRKEPLFSGAEVETRALPGQPYLALKFLLARNRPETHTRSRTLSSDKGSGGPARGLHKLGLPEVNVCAPYVSPVSALGPPSAGRWGHPISGEEQELHYAFLRFPKLKPREQEDINTEYSEIKTYKPRVPSSGDAVVDG
uniref:sialic acid-binding Ig-like lectin 6 n=1 Tax=Panthera onca TaxID=9690 RepID=UPI002953FAA5|nr:sialic acid-binding Ig-like lectin 6 [Panthera onca]